MSTIFREGGRGSGNYGHKGRPGVEGGSKPTGVQAQATSKQGAAQQVMVAPKPFAGVHYGSPVTGPGDMPDRVVHVSKKDSGTEVHMVINGRYVITDASNVMEGAGGMSWNGVTFVTRPASSDLPAAMGIAKKLWGVKRKFAKAKRVLGAKTTLSKSLAKAAQGKREAGISNNAQAFLKQKSNEYVAKAKYKAFKNIERKFPG